MKERICIDVSDGKEVANGLDLYVNSYSHPTRRFYEVLLGKNSRVQHNFTMLCLEWLLALSRVTYYDGRNEACVMFAKGLPVSLRYANMEKKKLGKGNVKKAYSFDNRSDDSAAELVERYLRFTKNNDLFITQMLNTHKTLQQSFSRLCCEWLLKVSKLPARRKLYVCLAQKAVENYHGFPLV